jgi:hypothetical protein
MRSEVVPSDRTPKADSDMGNASSSVTQSALQPLLLDQQAARRTLRLFLLGQCAGSLLLVLVLAAAALEVVATVSVFESTTNLIENANTDAR